MRNKLFILISLLFIAMSNVAKAQVEDVSVTVSPLLEYQWWNGNINLDNNMFYGLRLGFGFGPNFELRTTIEKSLDIKSKLKSADWNLSPEFIDKLPDHKVNITRFGGEAKFNILSQARFSPYITAGAGVQYFDYDPIQEGIDAAEYKEQQVYASIGAGIKMNISPRVVFTLEGKNVLFNMDPTNIYFNPHTHDKEKHLSNYAALASLDIYLGGINTRRYSALDARVRDSYTSGFARGLKFVVEPGMALLTYNKDLNLPNQWFVGGSAGVDFSSLVGIRGFYYQATETPNKLSLKFNDQLRMYGVNVIARLNQPRGIVPYLQLGAGYLDDKNAAEKTGEKFVKHNLFAQAGAGIEVPLSKYFALYGSANAMLMSQKGSSALDIVKPSEVRTNMMYTAGLRINLGASAASASSLYSSSLERERERSIAEINALRSEYDKKLADLNEQLAQAMQEGNVESASSILAERDAIIEEKATAEDDLLRSVKSDGRQMTAREFEALVNRVVKNITEQQNAGITSSVSNADFATIMSALQQGGNVSTDQALVNELKALSGKIEKNNELLMMNNAVRSENNSGKQIITVPSAAPAQSQPLIIHSGDSSATPRQGAADVAPVATPAAVVPGTPFLRYNMLAPIVGFNLGEQATANIGIRAYLQVSNTRFDFVPELFIALGKHTGYGLSANVIYNTNISSGSIVEPYVGAGLGLVNQGKGLNAVTNIILGTNIKLGSSSIFVDYTIRNLFKNNQIAVGYRFVF